eukprot:349960-Chlamydomonas_euryale.AAC.5
MGDAIRSMRLEVECLTVDAEASAPGATCAGLREVVTLRLYARQMWNVSKTLPPTPPLLSPLNAGNRPVCPLSPFLPPAYHNVKFCSSFVQPFWYGPTRARPMNSPPAGTCPPAQNNGGRSEDFVLSGCDQSLSICSNEWFPIPGMAATASAVSILFNYEDYVPNVQPSNQPPLPPPSDTPGTSPSPSPVPSLPPPQPADAGGQPAPPGTGPPADGFRYVGCYNDNYLVDALGPEQDYLPVLTERQVWGWRAQLHARELWCER